MVNHGMGVHGIVRRRVHGPSLRNPSSRELFIKNVCLEENQRKLATDRMHLIKSIIPEEGN